MRARLKLLAAILGVSVLSGCASMAPQSSNVAIGSQANTEAELEKVVEPILPEVELTPALLNKYLLADIAIQRAQYGAAIDLYREIALETRDPRLLERATRVAWLGRRNDIALETGRVWLEISPQDMNARTITTTLLIRNGDYDEALASLESLLEVADDDDHKRYLIILKLLGREQNKDGARELMEKFLERHPDDVAGLYAYAQLALRDGKIEESEASVDRLLELKPDWTPGVIIKTRLLQARNDEDAAIAYIKVVVGRNGKDVELRTAYARMLVDVGQLEQALEQFKKALKRDEGNTDTLFAAATVALKLEALDDAKVLLEKLWKKGVRRDEVSYYLGRIAESRGDNEVALRWFAKVDIGANYIDAQIRYALILAREDDVEAARAHLSAVTARGVGQRLKLYIAEGEILREHKQYQEAMDLYDHALTEIPNRIELLYTRAMVADKLDRLDILERDLLAILENEPDHVDALNSLGYTLADRTDRYQEAYAYIKRAIDLRPDAAYIMDSFGWVLYRLGEYEEAAKYLHQALELTYDPEIAAHLGEVLWTMGDRSGAREIWDMALEKSPDSQVLRDSIKRLDE